MVKKLAVNGGDPLRSHPFHAWPVHDDKDKERLVSVLASGKWGGFGDHVREFEEKFASHHGARDGVAVTNGTVTLLLCLRALGIKPGDEVIVPAVTWIATATAVLEANAVPVIVDVDPTTSCLDPAAFEAAITSRTVAVIPVHLYSSAADMDAILAIARRHHLALIEDCAHAHGASFKGKALGSWGDLGSFSFQMSKVMTAGEGGLVTSNDKSLLDKVYSLTNCGRATESRGTRILGGNHRMTDWQAAILLGQLERLDQQIHRREENLSEFTKMLEAIPGLSVTPRQAEATQSPWYRLSLRYEMEQASGIPLPDLIKAVRAEGVPVEFSYPPVYQNNLYATDQMSWYSGKPRTFRCPVAEELVHEKIVTVPHEIFLGTKQDIQDVASAFEKVMANPGEASGVKSRLKSSAKKLLRKVI